MLATELWVEEPRLRVRETDATAALCAVVGSGVVAARARLRYGPGRTCEPVARLLDRAVTQAERAGHDPGGLVLLSGTAVAAEDIVRVRRKAHGKADWIHSPTCRVRLEVAPAGTPAVPAAHRAPRSPAPPLMPEPVDLADPAVAAVHTALEDVIDPDLGIGIVDLGFVRGLRVEGRTAEITMTLTSPACPVTGVMENQIRTAIAALGEVDDVRLAWVWVPAWQPSDITESGREQLRAIGFTI